MIDTMTNTKLISVRGRYKKNGMQMNFIILRDTYCIHANKKTNTKNIEKVLSGMHAKGLDSMW